MKSLLSTRVHYHPHHHHHPPPLLQNGRGVSTHQEIKINPKNGALFFFLWKGEELYLMFVIGAEGYYCWFE